jgi:hypothetical protein
MNWPRYVKPAGIPCAPPPPSVIALASFLRIPSGSCLPTPRGPMREKRNGGAEGATSAASARPPALSVSSPSPSTK